MRFGVVRRRWKGRGPHSLKKTGFAILAGSNSASLLGYAGLKVVVGWVVLELTSSAFHVALAFALLMLPRLLFGLHLGVLIDHVDRRAAGAFAGLVTASLSLALAWLSSAESQVGMILLASFGFGLLEALRVIAIQTLVYDVVTPDDPTTAMALSNFVGNLGQGVGGLLIGALLSMFGSGAALVVIATTYVAGGMLLMFRGLSPPAVRPGDVPGRSRDRSERSNRAIGVTHGQNLDASAGLRRPRTWLAAGEIRSTMIDPNIRLLACIGITLEVLGFSSNALFPILARDVYGVGASGLGAMNAVRSLGAALGLLALVWAATRVATLHRGLLLVAFAFLFGISLAALGFTNFFPVAVSILFVVGVAAGSLDALLQTLLQAASGRRGSAMGVWVWTVGFAPIGQIQVGIIGTVLGAQLTLGINGLLLTAACALLAFLPATRRLR